MTINSRRKESGIAILKRTCTPTELAAIFSALAEVWKLYSLPNFGIQNVVKNLQNPEDAQAGPELNFDEDFK